MPDPNAQTYRRLIFAICAIAALMRLYLLITTHRSNEDFYITLRYAENIAAGRGFAYNPGEHVLGTTTPLYTLILALFKTIGLNAALFGKLINIAADSVTVYFIFRLASTLRKTGVGLVAAALFAIWPPCLYWSISGMETSLVTMYGIAAITFAVEYNRVTCAISCAVLTLLRIDGILLSLFCFSMFLFPPAGADRKVQLKLTMRMLGMYLLLLTPWLIFAFAYFGSPVPTSLIAKLSVYAWHAKSRFPNIGPFLAQMKKPHYVLISVFAIVGMVSIIREKSKLLVPMLWMLTYYAGMALSKSFLFGWYFVPSVPIHLLVASVGLVAFVSMIITRTIKAGQTIPHNRPEMIAACVILVLGLTMLPAQQKAIAQDQSNDEVLLKMIGLEMKPLLAAGKTLMLEPIGYIGYFSEGKILDAVGLVSPQVVSFYRQEEDFPYAAIARSLKPDYILLRAGEYENLIIGNSGRLSGLADAYVEMRTFAVPGVKDSRPAFTLLKRRN